MDQNGILSFTFHDAGIAVTDVSTSQLTRRGMMEQAAIFGLAICSSIPSAMWAEPLQPRAGRGAFPLIAKGSPASVVVDASAHSAVAKVADSFADDLARVSDHPPKRFARLADAQDLWT